MRALLRDAQDQTRIALEVEECPDSNATINDKRDTFLRVSLFLLVGQVGIEPTMFLMSRFYRPLRSPTTRTDPYGGERRTRI